MLNPRERQNLEAAGTDLSRGLVLALLLGTVVLVGLVIWFLRMGGGIWS